MFRGSARICLHVGHVWLISAAIALLLGDAVAQDCPSSSKSPCVEPLEICPIPLLRIHVGFPVEYRARVRHNCPTLTKVWEKVDGPEEFDIDNAGGLFYWTPANVPRPDGRENLTVRVTLLDYIGGQFVVVDEATESFQAAVDDNSMIYPLWRDYLSEENTVDIDGRAMSTPDGGQFESYSLEFARVQASDVPPADEDWIQIGTAVTSPVETTGRLGEWDIAKEPDGGRYYLRLIVNLDDGTQSIVENQVIIDRSASPGWPKRVEAISHSPVLADITDDGRCEVLVVTHSGKMYVWDIEGNLLWNAALGGATHSAPSIGDIDQDGRPEILWTIGGDDGRSRLVAYHADGVPVAGFPIPGPPNRVLRVVPTLADLDGDGVLDIIIGSQGMFPPFPPAQIWAYRYDVAAQAVQALPGWPQDLSGNQLNASASVADLDGDQHPDVIVESLDYDYFGGTETSRAYVFDAHGTALPGWEGGVVLDEPITDGFMNGGGGSRSISQPAIADLDGDGSPEIIIGSNILQADGTQIFSDSGAKNALSAAVGDLDHDPFTLEVVVGEKGWRWDSITSSFVSFDPFTLSRFLSPAIIGDCGEGHRDVVAGNRATTTPGVIAFHVQGEDAGQFFDGYPKSLYGKTGDAGAPVIGDFNGDGCVQVAAAITDASYGGVVAVWDMSGENRDEHHAWPMMGHNVRHTGAYCDAPPNRPGMVEETRTTSSITLRWEDRSAVEDGYLIERSSSDEPWSYQEIATLAPNTTEYATSEGERAFYRVRALRYDGRTGERVLSRFARNQTRLIPAVSTWGIVVTIVLLCTAATLILGERCRAGQRR